MTRAYLLRFASLLTAWAVVSAAGADDKFPKEGEDNFIPKLKAAVAAIKPLAETAIPDDPPPHEGALFDVPYVIEPPDLLLVEVIEALPGRPISGERLVRADGTITLGFYGSVHVRGLTLGQAKVKIVEHLRNYLPDQTLGLFEDEDFHAKGSKAADLPPPPPDLVPFATGVTKEPPARQPTQPPRPVPPADRGVVSRAIAPEDTNRIFIDVSAYNSKYYYVTGDVAAPGRMPIQGNETVLDALNYAGGFIATADPGNIRLIRPACGGKTTKIYPIDYKAITEQGEKRQNYQIFPGDRLVVGRSTTVQTTIYLDRMAAVFQSLITSLGQASSVTRNLILATPDLTPGQRAALLKEWFEVVWKASNQPGGPTPDETTFRDMLLLQLRVIPRPEKSPERK